VPVPEVDAGLRAKARLPRPDFIRARNDMGGVNLIGARNDMGEWIPSGPSPAAGLLPSLNLALALSKGAIFMKFGLAPATRTIFMVVFIEFAGSAGFALRLNPP